MTEKPSYEELEQRIRELETAESARKQAEKALRKSSQRLQKVFDAQPDAILVLNAEVPARIVECNRSVFDVFGYEMNELVGEGADILHVDETHLKHFQKILKTAMEKKGFLDKLEYIMKRKDGTVFPSEHTVMELTSDEGGRIGWVSIVRDLTERKRSEKALMESEERSRLLSDVTMEGILIHKQGIAQDVNLSLSRLLGYNREELLGKNFLEFVYPEDLKIVEENIVKDYAHPYETRGVKKGGDIFWAEVEARNFIARDDKLRVAAVRDITERKKTENALLESERKYRLTFDASPDAVNINRLKDGLYVDINDGFSRLTGFTREDVIGKTSFEINIWHDPKDRKELVKVLQKNGFYDNLEAKFRRKDGSLTTALMSARIIYLENVPHIISITRDISDRKEVEEALRERERQYNAIVENSGDYIMRYDQDHRHVYANRLAIEATGLSQEEYLGKTHREMGFPEHLCKLWENAIDDVFATGEERKVEFDVELDQGMMTLELQLNPEFDAEGRVHSVIGVSRDVTERKKAQREDRLNKARLEIIHEIAMLKGAAEREICDLTLEKMLDLSDSEIGFLGFMTEDEKVMRIHAWSSSAMGDCAIHDKPIEFFIEQSGLWGESVRQRKPMIVNSYDEPHPAKRGYPEGHVQVSRFMTVPVFDANCIVAVAAVGNKINPYNETDLRQLDLLMDSMWEHVRTRRIEQEKESLSIQLQRAQKIEAIGTLAGGIAHDFNNILSAIIGFTELVEADLPEDSRKKEDLQEVLKASDRAKNLVKQILTFSRQGEKEIKPLRLDLIVNEALKMIRSSLPTSIEIRQSIKSNVPTVLADPTQVHQVIMNLCTNAAQALQDEHGTVEVFLDEIRIERNRLMRQGNLKPGRYVRLRVLDTGKGIPLEVQDKVFEPYFTTKKEGQGTGLGLSVVYGIVQECGGGIDLDSEIGKGTAFTVYFPVAASEETEPVGVHQAPLPKGWEHILFVDDEKPIAQFGKQYLEQLGYRVTTRQSAMDALELFRDSPERFDLVVTDLTMPNMTGDRLAVELFRIRPDIPIILCTGYSTRITEREARALGIQAFVMKPLTQHELARTVRRVLDEDQ